MQLDETQEPHLFWLHLDWLAQFSGGLRGAFIFGRHKTLAQKVTIGAAFSVVMASARWPGSVRMCPNGWT